MNDITWIDLVPAIGAAMVVYSLIMTIFKSAALMAVANSSRSYTVNVYRELALGGIGIMLFVLF
jgi:hypothetical protein